MYQLIKVEGETIYNPYKSIDPEYVSNYTQEFTFDTLGLGNMTTKTSSEKVSPHKTIGDDLNYEFVYNYDENYAHRLVNIGNRYYKYDSNGNIICEQEGAFEDNDEVVYRKVTEEAENVYSTDYGWGLFKEEIGGSSNSVIRYKRTYSWNEKNQLISSVDESYSTSYVYGQDGQRSNKYTTNSETLYFNKMWTLHTDSGNSSYGGQYAKNIYLGETRIVTKLNSGNNPTYQEEYYKQYFYHSDHLGSASLISDYEGNEYQRIEYTPYGETWVEKTNNTGLEFLPYKFTAKEQDEETGLYYYGARYLDPKYSMWISTDPALGEYIPQAPINDEAKKNNQNLPGMGGVFNHINSNLYHYGGNNPVRYVDPDGRFDIEDSVSSFIDLFSNREKKYIQFSEYIIDRYLEADEYEFYRNNPNELNNDSDIFYREKKNGYEYCIATKTEFGKMTKEEKLTAISNEYDKLIGDFESNKNSIKDVFINLGYGLGEAFFNIAQNSCIEEFVGNFILDNLENIGDLTQCDLDGINILLDMSFLEKKYEIILNSN